MNDTNSVGPRPFSELPDDFSFLREHCRRIGRDYERVLAECETRERSATAKLAAAVDGRPILPTGPQSGVFPAASPTPGPSRSEATRCPFCTGMTREAQVDFLMELLFDAIMDMIRSAKKGGER